MKIPAAVCVLFSVLASWDSVLVGLILVLLMVFGVSVGVCLFCFATVAAVVLSLGILFNKW